MVCVATLYELQGPTAGLSTDCHPRSVLRVCGLASSVPPSSQQSVLSSAPTSKQPFSRAAGFLLSLTLFRLVLEGSYYFASTCFCHATMYHACGLASAARRICPFQREKADARTHAAGGATRWWPSKRCGWCTWMVGWACTTHVHFSSTYIHIYSARPPVSPPAPPYFSSFS